MFTENIARCILGSKPNNKRQESISALRYAYAKIYRDLKSSILAKMI